MTDKEYRGASELPARLLAAHTTVVRDQATASGPISLSGSETTLATVTLTIPSEWSSWAYEAVAAARFSGTSASSNRTLDMRIDRAGTDDHTLRMTVTTTPSQTAGTIPSAASGLTGTGSVAFTFTAELGANDNYDALDILMWVRATRES